MTNLKPKVCYSSTKFFYKYYNKVRYKKKMFERYSACNLLTVNKSFFIHKGLYDVKTVFSFYQLGIKFGTASVTRKPFTVPIKRVKKKRKR